MPPPTITTSAVRHWRMPGNPFGARQRNAGHRGRLDRDGDQVLGFEMAHVGLAAGARDRLRLHRQHPQVVGQPAAAFDGIEPRRQFGILRADAGGIGAVLEVVEEARGAAELLVFGGVARMVVAQRNQCRGADRDGVGPQRQRLGHVGSGADAAGHDQLHSCDARRVPAAPARPAAPPPASVRPTCSMNTSWVAAVPPCMPSTTTTSAPACTASFTS